MACLKGETTQKKVREISFRPEISLRKVFRTSIGQKARSGGSIKKAKNEK